MIFWNSDRSTLARIEGKTDSILQAIHQMKDQIMSALTDLKTALTALGDSVTSATAEIELLLGKITAPGTSDADVQDAVAQIAALTQAINDEVAKAQAASP